MSVVIALMLLVLGLLLMSLIGSPPPGSAVRGPRLGP